MTTQFTLRDWNALPEGFPAQLFDGQLVREPSRSYRHQDITGQLYLLLVPLFGRRHVVLAPADVVLDAFNVLQPDVSILREEPPEESSHIGLPVAVFEVLSPSTAERDATVKTRKYLEAGIPEVWIVDADRRAIAIHDAGGVRVHQGSQLAQSTALPTLALSPDQVLARD